MNPPGALGHVRKLIRKDAHRLRLRGLLLDETRCHGALRGSAISALLAARCQRAYNFGMTMAALRASATSQVIRADRASPDLPEAESTPESRMSLVWELTLQCMAMQGGGSIEPRLQRSAVRIQRPGR